MHLSVSFMNDNQRPLLPLNQYSIAINIPKIIFIVIIVLIMITINAIILDER